MPEPGPQALWRVFPWDPVAPPGSAFSAEHFPPQAGTGRFDLSLETGDGAIYLAETPEHAVGERIQDLRGRFLDDDDLIEHGHRLALVRIRVAADAAAQVIDLCDPEVLASRRIRPDHLASRRRSVTRSVARRVYEDRAVCGLRWWSALDGDWHTVVLFRNRIGATPLVFEAPQHLTLDHVSVIQATDRLGIRRG